MNAQLVARSTLDQQRFFQQHSRSIPVVEATYWSFMLGGRVTLPLMLSYADLLAMPAFDFEALIACAGNSPGGPAVGQARWRGVSMTALLAEINPLPNSRYAHLYAVDGYSTSLSFEQLNSAVLVYAMNDAPLPPEHGGPLRLIVPGLYGYKMPKWIQRILLADAPLAGFWEGRGWPQSGTVGPTAAFAQSVDQIAVGEPVNLAGYAFAGRVPVAQIELSVEDGPWMSVPVEPNAPQVAAYWSIDWTPPTAGAYVLRVRARDAQGQRQTSPLHTITLYAR